MGALAGVFVRPGHHQFLKPLGVTEAYNFDGGGSTAMYFNGKIINKPVNSGRITERFVSDIVYIPE